MLRLACGVRPGMRLHTVNPERGTRHAARVTCTAHHKVAVHTVDSFQGSEAAVVICSFVRSNPQSRVGFLSDYKRLNVALTRAKFYMLLYAGSDRYG